MQSDYVKLINQAKANLNEATLKETKEALGPGKHVTEYFKLLVEKCLDKCDTIKYNELSNTQKKFFSKMINRIGFSLLTPNQNHNKNAV